MPRTDHSSGPAHDYVEIGVAVAIILFGLIIVIGSVQAGIGWGREGPLSLIHISEPTRPY